MIVQRFFTHKVSHIGLSKFISCPWSSKASTVASATNPLTTVSLVDGVRRITLTNVKGRNMLSLKVMEEILHHLTYEENDPNLRCIVFAAEGPVFSSGHNLKELTSSDGKQFHHQVFGTCSQLMERIIQSPVPVIAAVDGLAAAAGCQLVAQCDIVVCTENSTFSTPGAKFGIFCSTPGVAIARSVNRKVAAHMLFTGLPISSEEALRAGLVSKVVVKDKLEEEVNKTTAAIKANSRSVIMLGKKFFYQQLEKDIMTAYRLGSDIMVNNLSLADGQEGIQGFIEKRKPQWGHNFDKA